MPNALPTVHQGDTESTALRPERAFVVEFGRADPSAADEHLSGRVEHVVSGRAAHFASADELLAFVRSVLQSPGQRTGGVT